MHAMWEERRRGRREGYPIRVSRGLAAGGTVTGNNECEKVLARFASPIFG
jgi:hypothetical protein